MTRRICTAAGIGLAFAFFWAATAGLRADESPKTEAPQSRAGATSQSTSEPAAGNGESTTPKTAPAATAAFRKGLDFFEAKIRPMLVTHCYECHSAKAAADKKLKGALFLDTREGVLRGGESGPAIVPGKPDDSLLISALRHESFEMPPKGKLPDEIIADFVRWIELGAPDPRDGASVPATAAIDVDEGKQFWAFRPLSDPAVPEVQNKAWPRTDIDRFILAWQEAAGVTPNGPASAEQLLRRVFFDLTGLPPTEADLDRWLPRLTGSAAKPASTNATQPTPQAGGGDAAPINAEAYAELIDELLASERYGERWARHWLDLMRFAESNGYAFDKDRPNAFHYRDWVIRALNRDLPYDKFVTQQIAGDLLAPANPSTPEEAQRAYELIAATGAIVAGPFTTQQTQKERERSRYEQLDDIVNTLGTSLLGLTLGCCRCHSHKYDPLPQRDYYRLAACFADVGFADVGINMRPDEYRAAKAKFDAEHTPLVAARTKYEREQLPGKLETWLAERAAGEDVVPALQPWQHIGPFPAASFDAAFDTAFAPEKDLDLTHKHCPGKTENGKCGVPELAWTAQPAWVDGTVHNTLTGENAANYLYRAIEVSAARSVVFSLGSDDGVKVWVNGKQVLANKVGRGAAPDQEKVTVKLKAGRNDLLMKIVNGGGPSGFYFKSSLGEPPKPVLAILNKPRNKWSDKDRDAVLKWFATLDDEWQRLNGIVAEHAKKEPKPQMTNVYAAKVRGSTYQFGPDTYKVYFLRRGNADNKEAPAEPGFLQVLMRGDGADNRWLRAQPSRAAASARSSQTSNRTAQATQAAAADPSASGASQVTGEPVPPRLALAHWLTDVDNGAGMLLARVIVNRLWQHHFGRGIVATPSDFGTRGERPTHPQLLDWLARQLIAEGWRLKPIHRLILTSSVYMQSGTVSEANRKLDPENRLLWRQAPRRLEAEAIRDSLLAVAGTLDLTMYGPGSLDERTPRRSVYLRVKRSVRIPFLQLFDAPDTMQGIGTREESTVAPQALALLNSAFVRDLAGKLAARVQPASGGSGADWAAATRRVYRICYGRAPSDDEAAALLAFIDRQTAARGGSSAARGQAFRDACHLLLCSNEFVFVD